MESKPSEAGKPSAPSSEGTSGGGVGGPVGPPSTSQTATTTASSSPFPRIPPIPPSSSSSSSSTIATATAQSRSGLALGVPAHHSTRPHQAFTTFGPTPPPSVQHQHQFLSSMNRGPDPSPSPSSTSQARSTSPGIQNIGMFGSLNAGQLRASGPSASQPQRPGQSAVRSTPPSSSNPAFNQQQRMASQGLSRPPSSMPSPSGSTTPSLSQQMQMHGPSLPPPYRPPQQRPPQTLQQTRPVYHGPIQHLPQTPQHTTFPPQPQATPFLPQASRVPASGGIFTPGGDTGSTNLDVPGSGDKIITKKTIKDLFSQVDPSEKLEAEVEDALVEIAEDFVESLTTFACSLAKHRKSATLETKDILLHAERNWNITPPGFSGEELKLYRKQNVSDIHRERLQLIKKTMGDPRTHAAKAAAAALTSPAPQQHRP
ncbi:Transcription initiation factor TFIID subunit 12 [Rhynchospora pubera]|uniref:Transcription initiation factor TFIID subunit 12 n=1 Tax=Rhynchospora pubera TaxID=906938 RepID=A0AAV8BYD3_9POAL|nr:Transcription initiation factor TFIID subunit 12 [Rhynchospora pubera]